MLELLKNFLKTIGILSVGIPIMILSIAILIISMFIALPILMPPFEGLLNGLKESYNILVDNNWFLDIPNFIWFILAMIYWIWFNKKIPKDGSG